MSNIEINSSVLGNSLQALLTSQDITPGDSAGYELCKQLWIHHPLCGKIAEKAVRLALSKPRQITMDCEPKEMLIEAYQKEWEALDATSHIRDVMFLKRVYGAAAIIVGAEGVPTTEPLDPWKLSDLTLYFNQFDPLNLAGSIVTNQDPNAPDFQKPKNMITAAGQPYHPSRSVVVFNGTPIYLSYQSSAFGFTGRSVFQRALYPLRSFIQSMVTDDLVTFKAGLLIAKQKPAGSIVNRLMQTAAGIKRTFLQEGTTGNVLSIDLDEEIESIDLTNTATAMTTARDNIIANIAAATDVPALLLKDEAFTQGFGEGTEDAKAIVQYVNGIREEMISLFAFFDKIVMHRAWNKEFYDAVCGDPEYGPHYSKMTYEKAFYEWQHAFKAEWENLIEEPQSEKVKADDIKLKGLTEVLRTFLPVMDPVNRAAVIQWACDNLNEMPDMFDSVLTIDAEALAEYEPPEPMAQPKEPTARADAMGPVSWGYKPRGDADFKESDHPRDNSGKFGSGGGAKKAEESTQGRANREWRENYDRVANTDDLSEVPTRDIERAANWAAGESAHEKRKGWDGGEVNKNLVTALEQERDRLNTELKNRRLSRGDADFKEADHPRDAIGRFGSGGGLSNSGEVIGATTYEKGKRTANLKTAQSALNSMGFDAEVEYAPGGEYARTTGTGPTAKITLNSGSEYWFDPAKQSKKDFKEGLVSTPHHLHAVLHEAAHAEKALPNDQREFAPGEQATAAKVSKYAGQNRNEFISEYRVGTLLGKEYSNDVDALYSKLTGDLDAKADADFKEADHPRDKDGKFGSGGGGSAASTPAGATQGGATPAAKGHDVNWWEKPKDAPREGPTDAKGYLKQSYKPEYVAALAPEQRKVMRKMYERAAANKNAFDAINTEIADSVPGARAAITNIKGTERAAQKTILEYDGDPSNVKDLLRTTFAVQSMDDVPTVLEKVSAQYGEFIKFRNLLDPAVGSFNDTGYRDVTAVVMINGTMAEIQINMPKMLLAKEKYHGHYEVIREYEGMLKVGQTLTDEQFADLHRLNDEMVSGYEAVWAEMMASKR